MQVIKVGGSVLNSVAGFRRFSEIISLTKENRLIVVSAFAKTTRDLSLMARSAEKGLLKQSKKELDEIIQYHLNFSRQLILNEKLKTEIADEIMKCSSQITGYIESIALTKELPARIKDHILSNGEKFALIIIDKFLQDKSIEHRIIDSSDIIVTDEQFGKAKPLEKETSLNIEKKLLPEFSKTNLVITQGFVARSKKKSITTMGTESSNLSAALYAKLLDAKELHFWSDVEGIRSADPLVADNTKLISIISYDTAFEFGLAGLKLIYPDMIDYARAHNIRLIFKSAFEPQGGKTIIKEIGIRKSAAIISSDNLFFYRMPVAATHEYRFNIGDVVITEGNDKVIITKSRIPSIQAINAGLITVFNIAIEKILPVIFDKYKKINSDILFLSTLQDKTIIAVKNSQKNTLVRTLHDSLIK